MKKQSKFISLVSCTVSPFLSSTANSLPTTRGEGGTDLRVEELHSVDKVQVHRLFKKNSLLKY